MRIAIFSDSYRPQVNGVTNCIDSIRHELEKSGNEVFVIAPTGTPNSFHSIEVPFYREYRHAIFPYIKCLRIIRRFGPDIIHSHTPFSMGIAAILAGRILGVPVVSTFHTLIPEYFSYYFFDSYAAKSAIWEYFAHYYKRSAAITTPSKTVKSELEKRLKRKVELIVNGVDCERFSPSNRKKGFWKKYGLSEKKIMLHVGRLSPERSVIDIVEGVGSLASKRDDTALAIVGKGPAERELKEAAKKHNGKIVFTRYLPGKELAKAYASSYAFVNASRTDTYPLVLLESYASGIPCIGVNSEGVGKLIKKDTGLLFNDRNGMFRQAERILDNEKLRSSLSKSARKFAEKHSWKIIAGRYLELYEKLLNKAPQAPAIID